MHRLISLIEEKYLEAQITGEDIELKIDGKFVHTRTGVESRLNEDNKKYDVDTTDRRI